jgi:ABC-type sulfate transport system substrate-binding protein
LRLGLNKPFWLTCILVFVRVYNSIGLKEWEQILREEVLVLSAMPTNILITPRNKAAAFVPEFQMDIST